MKKLILLIGAFVAIATIYISCDTRKFLKDETPVPPALVVDSIAFDLTRDVDTINTQVLTFGGYSWRFRCFDKNKNPLTNVSLPASFHYLLNTGTQSYNTKTLSDTTLRSDSYYYIKYLPAYVNGKHQFDIALNNGHGKTFTDTVRFFVKTYNSVAYTESISSKTFSCLRPTSSTAAFNLTLTTGDPSHQIKYYLNYILPANVLNAQGNLLLNGAAFSSGSQIAIGGNAFTLNLVGHPTGNNFKMPLKIVDQNGDFKLDTITYSCQANSIPVITTASTTFNRASDWTSSFGPTTKGNALQHNVFFYAFLNNTASISNNFNINITDDGLNCSGVPNIVAYKVIFPDNTTLQVPVSATSNISINNFANGSITYQYLRDLSSTYIVYGTGSCTHDHTPDINLYQDASSCGVNGQITNNGSYTTIYTGLKFQTNQNIRISVQDSEGAWSIEYILTPNSYNGIDATTALWH